MLEDLSSARFLVSWGAPQHACVKVLTVSYNAGGMQTKGRFGKAPLTANPHNHKASNPAATTGGNRGQTNISETGPRYAAVVAEGFAASCPTTEWTPTSDKSTTRCVSAASFMRRVPLSL